MILKLCRKKRPSKGLSFAFKHLPNRFAILFIVFIGLKASAESFSQGIIIKAKNTSFSKVLNTIKKQSGYTFFYNDKLIDSEGSIDVEIKNMNLESALAELFRNKPYSYKIVNRTVVINRSLPSLATSNPVKVFVVKGKIIDGNGMPLVSAVITIKGKKNITTSNTNGEFAINAENGDVLIIKYVGFVTRELIVADDTKILTIQLSPDQTDLSEVVVTALGVKRSEKVLGYATQRVSGKEVNTVKGVDLGTSLTGRVSGLVIKNSTEFNTKPTIQLRGETARIIIDGAETDNITLRDVPQDDIESIDILKGSAAVALYGARFTGGAILITTKKGSSDGISINLNSNTMLQLGFLSMPEIQTSYGRGDNGKIANDYVWGPKLDVGNTARDWNPETMQFEDNRPLNSIGKNNLQNFMDVGIISNNNISISQGTDKASFKLGLNHVYNKGAFPNQELNIMNITGTGEIKLSEQLKLETHFGIRRNSTPQTWGGGYNNQGYLYQLIMWTGPEYDIRDYKNYWKVPNQTQNWMYTNWYDNPYLIAYEKLNGRRENLTNFNTTANYKFSPDLNLMLRLTYDNYNNQTTQRNPTANIFSVRGGFNARGMYSITDEKGYSTSNDLILNYNKKFGQFSIESLAGGNFFYKEDQNISGTTKNGLISPTFYSLAGSVEPPTVSQYWSPKEMVSVYGRAAFGWKDAVFIDFTGRNDWSSTQPTSTSSYFYPSLGSSIIISELVKFPKVVDMWKLRGSITEFKTPADIYAVNRTYNTATAVWNGLNTASYPGGLLGGDDVLPTSTRTWEIGTAGYLFKNRLHFDVAYFNKYYFNRQVNPTISQASGFSTTFLNTKETYTRRGLEITIDGTIVKSRNFEWRSLVNWSNQHRYYDDLDPVYSSDSQWVKKGERLDAYLASYWLTDPQGNIIHTNGVPVTSNYQKKYGYGEPDFSFGFFNNFTYKNWNLGINIDGRIGALMFNYVYDNMFDTGTHIETDNQYRYDQTVNGLNNYVGQGVKIVSGSVAYDKYGNITSDSRVYAPNDVKVGYESYARAFRGGDKGIQEETFVKLREISLGYNFNKHLLAKIGLKRAAISITGQNLLLLTNFKFSDPDVDTENLNAPSQRMMGFNLKIGL